MSIFSSEIIVDRLPFPPFAITKALFTIGCRRADYAALLVRGRRKHAAVIASPAAAGRRSRVRPAPVSGKLLLEEEGAGDVVPAPRLIHARARRRRAIFARAVVA